MCSVPSSRPPSRSRTRFYRYAWLAAKYEGQPGRGIPEFFRRHFGVDVSEDTVDNEVRPVRQPSKLKKPRGPRGVPSRPPQATPEPMIWTDWLLADEHALGLKKLLLRIPNDGQDLDHLVTALTSMPGIRQVVQTKEDQEVFAIAILRTDAEEENLRARVHEHAPGHRIRVHSIRYESHDPTPTTWLWIAKNEAAAQSSED